MKGRKQYELEYIIRSSPQILYNFISTPSGLAQWFADNVDLNKEVFSFFWEGTEERAVILDSEEDRFIRLQWEDGVVDEYFEFSIRNDDITGDTALMINDFADEKEIESQTLLWNSQVKMLMERIGS
ncbi:MAG: hypothetical protein IH946_07645 [Bacteroidetes bacterium]|nr:hypothetical protein [Bacteroidota bacterium]